MCKRKSLCIIGIAAALFLSACGEKKETKEFVTHGENVTNGDVSLIMDSEEGKKAPLTRPPEESRVTLTIGVVKNDGAAMALSALAAENEKDESFEKYKFVYADNYTALAEQLKSKTIGVAVMPPTKALDLYATDKSVKVLASISNKNYRIIGENINALSDLAGKTVYVSADDKTASCIMAKLLAYAGIKDCTVKTLADNNAILKAVESKEAEFAVMQEPYIAMLKSGGAGVHTYDFAQDWENATEGNSYCTGCLVASNEFITEQKAVIDYMLDDVARSVETIKDDTAAFGANAAKYGFADDAKTAEEAYPGLDCSFFKDKQMRYLINNMFTSFDNAGQEVLGTDIPDEEFYMVKE